MMPPDPRLTMRASLLTLPALGRTEPLTFATEFPRSDGSRRAVSFTGELGGDAVTGRLGVGGTEVDVVARLGKESVTGQFEVEGKPVGRFAARVMGRELHGSYELEGEVGAWQIPLREIPKEARDLLEATRE
jgi:hypothetical protein